MLVLKSLWVINKKQNIKCEIINFASIACIADTSRHYLPVDVIKQVIDSMSFSKLVILPSSGLCLLSYHYQNSLVLKPGVLSSRTFFIGISLMNNPFHWRCQHIQTFGKVHTPNGSATPWKMHMILSSMSLYHSTLALAFYFLILVLLLTDVL